MPLRGLDHRGLASSAKQAAENFYVFIADVGVSAMYFAGRLGRVQLLNLGYTYYCSTHWLSFMARWTLVILFREGIGAAMDVDDEFK